MSEWVSDWSFNVLSASKTIFRVRTYIHVYMHDQSGDDFWSMELGGNLPPEHDALLFSISDLRSFIYRQSHRHGWAYQDLWLPSHTDTAGHTKAFDYPATQTRLDIPRPFISQSWTTGGKSRRSVFRCDADLHWRHVSSETNTLTTDPPSPPPPAYTYPKGVHECHIQGLVWGKHHWLKSSLSSLLAHH